MQIQPERDFTARRAFAAPGSGRLGIVSAYFKLSGVAGVLGTAAITAQLLAPDLRVQTTPLNPFAALVVAILMTVGFFRTSRLLDQRQKSGAYLATLCFIGPLIGYLTGSAPSLATLVIAGTGLALVASVWRHLE